MSRGLRITLIITIVLIIFAVASSVASRQQKVEGDRATLIVGEHTLSLEIADEWHERVRGLSARTSLSNDEGLLFVFEEAGYHGIWMKDMNFSIDIIWLTHVVGEENQMRIVDIKKHILPGTYPTTFHPEEPASFVIELNAGVSDVLGLETGDVLDISFNKEGRP